MYIWYDDWQWWRERRNDGNDVMKRSNNWWWRKSIWRKTLPCCCIYYLLLVCIGIIIVGCDYVEGYEPVIMWCRTTTTVWPSCYCIVIDLTHGDCCQLKKAGRHTSWQQQQASCGCEKAMWKTCRWTDCNNQRVPVDPLYGRRKAWHVIYVYEKAIM